MEKCRWRSEPLARIVHCCRWKHCPALSVRWTRRLTLQDEMCAQLWVQPSPIAPNGLVRRPRAQRFHEDRCGAVSGHQQRRLMFK